MKIQLSLGDALSILLDVLFSPRRRVVKMGNSVYFVGSEGVYRYGPENRIERRKTHEGYRT